MSEAVVPARLRELIGLSEYWATALSRETDRLRNLGRLMGNIVTVMAAVTGAAIFAQLEKNPATWAKLVFGLVSLFAAVLAALQTYGALPERAAAAKSSREQFGSVFGQMLDAEDRIKRGSHVTEPELQSLYEHYQQLMEVRPPVSRRAEKQAKKYIKKKRLR